MQNRQRPSYADALGLRTERLGALPLINHFLDRLQLEAHLETFGLNPELASRLGDDAMGRALVRLFDADRGALVTAVVVAAVEAFGVALSERHNDSTTVKFCGQARGRRLLGKAAPWITFGYSKDDRGDLKQLLFILTTSEDGRVPVQFCCEAGNTNDAIMHVASCAERPGATTSFTWPIQSCAPAIRWITSTAIADASCA